MNGDLIDVETPAGFGYRLLAFIADGRVRVKPLHTRTIGLADLESTMQELASGHSTDVKVLVDPRGEDQRRG